jgi:nucleoside-diphosphate-sugar epimerase
MPHPDFGVDAFTDYYARSAKEVNIETLGSEPTFTLVEADLATTPLEPLLDGVDGVFHLAAQPGVRGSWGSSFEVYVTDNVIVTRRLFEAAAERSLRVVFASSSSVYGDAESYPTSEGALPRPISPYGVTKLSCEHLAHAYRRTFGLDWRGMRYFTVYGPRQRPDMAFTRILSALVDGTTFSLNGTGEQSRDFTFVADAVSATVAAMTGGPPGSVYNVGGGAETTLQSVIDLCEKRTGTHLDGHREPSAAGDVRRTAADTTRIRQHLGWQPNVSLADGLESQLDEVRRRQARDLDAHRGKVHR